MKFYKVTSSKYVGSNGYTLTTNEKGRYSILKGGQITNWGTGFKTVRSAEQFIDKYDYIRATTTWLPISADDIEFIVDTYGFKYDEKTDEYWKEDVSFFIEPLEDDASNAFVINLNMNNDHEYLGEFKDVPSFLEQLDEILNFDNIVSSVSFRGISYRDIFARSNRRSSREIARDLIRVNSSNVWSYGMELKDEEAGIGDIYVQFKGEKGGPGDVYRYYDVPLKLWKKFISYPSKGAFIWKFLRNKFKYSKLTGNKIGVLPNAINH